MLHQRKLTVDVNLHYFLPGVPVVVFQCGALTQHTGIQQHAVEVAEVFVNQFRQLTERFFIMLFQVEWQYGGLRQVFRFNQVVGVVQRFLGTAQQQYGGPGPGVGQGGRTSDAIAGAGYQNNAASQ